ncbi:MAG TPA: carboxypeptidase regulatory-like domain-containing protein, partial [Pyrinomonadaceae bacterium]|nr:carboxypeptidase regulatory-like domain-containing protein [Pyrinomonadaceae bacterium]
MRSSARSALLAILTLVCFASSLLAQSTAKQPAPKTPAGSVSGRVTIKDKPAPGVLVSLRKSDAMSPYEQFSKAVTDANGFYRITNVAPGTYAVAPAAPAYVASDANGRKSVLVGDDEDVEGINFSLMRGGVITGKLTDADGRPVIQEMVEIYRAESLDQRTPERPAYSEVSAQTDDRGIYRIFGLTAGRYKVCAGRGDDNMAGYSPSQGAYKRVFHPDVAEAAKATVIEVSEGSEANNVDIHLGRTVQSYSASGRIVNGETGAPVPNLRFGLQRSVGTRTEWLSRTDSSNARGEFVVEGLIPGKYMLNLFQSGSDNDLRAEQSTFDVVDQDVSGIIIKAIRGASISGVVVLESDDKAARARLGEMQVRGYVQTSPGYGNSSSSPIAADGGFRLGGFNSGQVNVSLGGGFGPYPPKGFAIARIERDGVATPRIEVKEGEQVAGVKIFVAYGNAVLRGVINVENGPLPSGARLFARLSKAGEKAS